MKRIALNLRGLAPEQVRDKTQTILNKITGNANFPAPDPPLAELQATHDALDQNLNDIASAETGLTTLRKQRDALVEQAITGLSAEANYVETASKGDEAKLVSSGFDVAAERGAPQPLGQLGNLSASTGDNAGELDAQWDRLAGARSYEVQTSPDPITATTWQHAVVATRSSVTLGGLPSNAVRWVRVRAVGASGPGPWSNPARGLVP